MTTPGQWGTATASQPAFVNLSQLVGSSGEAEVLLEQPPACIKAKRTTKRGRRSDVEYLVGFQGFSDPQDVW